MGMTVTLGDVEMDMNWVYTRECDKFLGKSLLWDVLNKRSAKSTIDVLSDLGKKINAKQVTEDGIVYPDSIEDMVGRLISTAKKYPNEIWLVM